MRWLVIFSLLVLSGCASDWAAMKARTVESANADFRAAVPCCNKFSDLQYSEMPPEKGILSIDKTSQVFDFATGKSFVAAIVLPEFQIGGSLRVKSLLVGEGAFIPAKAMLFPIATFLDSQKHLIETIEISFIDCHSGVFSDTEGGGYGIIVIPIDANYVVFHTA